MKITISGTWTMTVDTHTDDPLEAHNNARETALFLIEHAKNSPQAALRLATWLDEMKLSRTNTTDKENPSASDLRSTDP